MVDEKYISQIVESILNEMGVQNKGNKKLLGVFDEMSDALEAAQAAYKKFRSYTVEQREKMIENTIFRFRSFRQVPSFRRLRKDP